MPIPALQTNGFLPEGIHECTIEEITDRFGRFQASDARPRLNIGLVKYWQELNEANIGKYLIVDGSFITNKDEPSDIDVLLVAKDDYVPTDEMPPFMKNPASRKYVLKNHKLDFKLGWDDDDTSLEYLALYQDVKYQPGLKKGILKIVL